MKTSKDTKQPPFKRGEWVRCMHGVFRVLRCIERWEAYRSRGEPRDFIGSMPAGRTLKYVALAGHGEMLAGLCRRASARELRAESKRLAKRAAELSAAADAVEEKKKRK